MVIAIHTGLVKVSLRVGLLQVYKKNKLRKQINEENKTKSAVNLN